MRVNATSTADVETGAVLSHRPVASVDRPRRARRSHAKPVWSYWRQYLAVAPFYVIFAVFGLFPLGFTLYLSFQRWDGLGDMQFVGLDQYRYLLDDSVFWQSLRNTLVIWVLSTVPMLFLALVVASMLHASVRFTGFYRIAYYVPNVTSLVAAAIVFGSIFATQFGLINAGLRGLGVSEVSWLQEPWGMKIAVASLITWQWTGYNAIIYLAGLQTIPSELYEAARVDGAGPVQCFWRITVPLLRPVILFTVIVSTVTGLQTFTEPQVLFGSNAATNPNSGGPGRGALTMVLYFYHQAFDNRDFGYGAAIAWAVFLVVTLFTIVNWRLVQSRKGA